MPDEQQLRAALHTVPDPELVESIVDLGLVKSIRIAEGRVDVVLIPTSATCPMGELLIEDATAALRAACPPACDVRVEFDWDTEWHPGRMSPELQLRFGW
ncbi:MAG TPA: metal-sulfur cluster assembly factor [Methyloversatilis sp.]